jgi:hypothetical protein
MDQKESLLRSHSMQILLLWAECVPLGETRAPTLQRAPMCPLGREGRASFVGSIPGQAALKAFLLLPHQPAPLSISLGLSWGCLGLSPGCCCGSHPHLTCSTCHDGN